MLKRMGDAWEEERLERRDAYAVKHRLVLSQSESDYWNYLIVSEVALMDELTDFTKRFRAAMGEIQTMHWVEPGHTLRQAYGKIANRNLLPGARLSLTDDIGDLLPTARLLPTDDIAQFLAFGSSSIVEWIADQSKDILRFGDAVASVAGINLCIRNHNRVRRAIFELSTTFYGNAFNASRSSTQFGWGETTSLETAEGELHLLPEPSEPQPLNEISLDLTIGELTTWKAAKTIGFTPR